MKDKNKLKQEQRIREEGREKKIGAEGQNKKKEKMSLLLEKNYGALGFF